jgi:hypothetical protein
MFYFNIDHRRTCTKACFILTSGTAYMYKGAFQLLKHTRVHVQKHVLFYNGVGVHVQKAIFFNIGLGVHVQKHVYFNIWLGVHVQRCILVTQTYPRTCTPLCFILTSGTTYMYNRQYILTSGSAYMYKRQYFLTSASAYMYKGAF